MKTLYETLLKAPIQTGDDIIKTQLSQSSSTDYLALDVIITKLHKTYSLYQIFKVYHQIFE